MTEQAGGNGSELAILRIRLEALTDFVVTVTAALVPDRALAAAVVQALIADEARDSPPSEGGETQSTVVARIARDVLAIAGCAPMPSPVRLAYSAEEQRPS